MAYGTSDPLPFGKYAGLSIGAIARFDPAYLLWIKRNLTNFAWTDEALALAKKAWTRDYYQKQGRQNGWAWGCGSAVRRAAEAQRESRIRIEAEERRKAASTGGEA